MYKRTLNFPLHKLTYKCKVWAYTQYCVTNLWRKDSHGYNSLWDQITLDILSYIYCLL